MLKPALFLSLALLALPATAQQAGDWRFGGDAFAAGRVVTLDEPGLGDVFAAGDKVTLRRDIDGSAHMAGRYVTLEGRIGGNLYGAGMDVEVGGAVAGSVTVLGDTLTIREPVSGNLRATGSDIALDAPVAGAAVLAGETVRLDASISGDLALAAGTIDWGPAAQVQGTLHLYSDDPEAIEVPERVAPEARITRHAARDFEAVDHMRGDTPAASRDRPGLFARLGGWLGGVIVVGLLATLLAVLAPGHVATLREKALARPLRTGWIGLLGLSALTGSVVFLAMTGIGLVLVPVALILAGLLAFGGYVLGAYVLGVWITGVAGRDAPADTASRALAAFAGAAAAAIVALVPFLGWLAVMAIFLLGAGAVLVRAFAPAFRVEEPSALSE